MEQERPRKLEYPLYKRTKDDRSNLVIAHDRNLAQAMTYSQTAMSILVLGATIAAFLYLILEDVGWTIADVRVADIRAYICLLIVLPIFALAAGKRTYLSWRYHLLAEFIEKELLGAPHTWEKINHELKIKYKLDNLDKKTPMDIKFGQLVAKRRYYLFLDKIYKHDKISKCIP